MEKFFSVSVEFNDGTTKAVAARGESHGSVFQQIKQMPGIRRVGKVTEVTPSVHESVQHGRPVSAEREARSPVHGTFRGGLDQPLRGPRVVSHARPVGGEQPFKHLQAPPERPKPPQPIVQPPPVFRVDPVPTPDSDPLLSQEYRIVRSRRTGGQPYLLQRGTWSDRDGKRIFKLDWEKGFDEREKAERHLQWVQQSEVELAEVVDSLA